MPKYEVMRKIDAWVREVAVVEAKTEEDALRVAYADEQQLVWEDAGIQTFDDRKFVLLDKEGLEF
ncbi:hypothetical protein [Hyphomonas sp.]|jgi:hypothetical protein|uniref:hypothetical protein n=1 Tax=Hyphomonas sp. TaxID=87 RepID=UPI0032D938E8